MKRKVIIASAAVAVCLITAVILFFSLKDNSSTPITVLDSSGEAIGVITKLYPSAVKCKKPEYSPYINRAAAETAEIISKREQVPLEKVNSKADSITAVKTAFNAQVFEACKAAYEESEIKEARFGAAFTDLNGALLCCFSSDFELDYTNQKNQPFSSIKPLSVYAPAIERGVINWSTAIEDTPVKKIKGDSGETVDWPTNGTGRYEYRPVTVCEAVKLSLNTVAVKSLLQLGAENSIEFLSDKLSMDMESEKRLLIAYGEEEILADLGLGYLKTGVTVADMAGYYQIFANGGMYVKPYTVMSIEKSDNELYYEVQAEKSRAVSEETAFIMNNLLQNTLTKGGTAQKAAVEGLKTGGKTGTGSNASGSWFAGFTPEYSFAIWHSKPKNQKNNCSEIFSLIAKNLPCDSSKDYPACSTVVRKAYCADSGGLITQSCREMKVGYYKAEAVPKECSEHR